MRRLGRVDETPLAAIPLDPKHLIGDRYCRIRNSPTISPKRRSAVVSLLNRVLKRAGIIKVGTRRDGALLVEWVFLLQTLPADDAKCLSPFAHACSSCGVRPDQVTLADWDAFVHETLHHSAVKKPRETINRVARTSNRARAANPAWPIPELPKLVNGRLFAAPKDSVPPSFWADVEEYCRKSITKPPNIFDKTWPKLLKPDTVTRHREQLWRMASAQIYAGRPPEEIASIAALMDFEWLETGFGNLHERAGGRFLKDHLNIAGVLISVAKRWLKDPDLAKSIRDEFFDVIAEELGAPEFSEKNIRKLDQFDGPEIANAFTLLPYTIWAEVKKKKDLTVEDAYDMAAAVAIEILLVTMMRRKNLASLDLARHFWPATPTAQGRWSIHLSAAEVKNVKGLNFKLRPETVRLLTFYLKKCRPLLLKQPTTRVFLRTDGEPMLDQDIYHLVTSRIRKRLGLDVNLHLFRHIGAMLFLDAHPGKLGVVQVMLGHKTIKTTERFYARLRATRAIEFFTEAVLGGREEMIKRLGLK